jgi:hypothetical protein
MFIPEVGGRFQADGTLCTCTRRIRDRITGKVTISSFGHDFQAEECEPPFEDLCHWILTETDLPALPFQLHPGVTINDVRFFNHLKTEATRAIAALNSGKTPEYRVQTGALQRDLLSLAAICDNWD